MIGDHMSKPRTYLLKELELLPANSVVPPLLSSISQGGGVTGEKNKPLKSQLRPLATLVPRLGRVGQGAWELGLPKIRKCHFFE